MSIARLDENRPTMAVTIGAFTLVEMIVASFVFTLVVMTAFLGLSAVQSSWERAHVRAKRLDRMLALDRTIDSAFRNAIPFSWPNDEGEEKPIFVGDPRSVSFAYIHRIGNIEEGAIRFIQIYRDGDRLMADYRKSPILPWKKNAKQMNTEILSENVEKISFKYADKKSDLKGEKIEWVDDWDEEDNPNMPLAIQIEVEWRDGDCERWLRRTAGSGPNESYGKPEKRVDRDAGSEP